MSIIHPFSKACALLGLPSTGTPTEAASQIFAHWDPQAFRGWPRVAQAVLCQIAIFEFKDKDLQKRLRAWACEEAPRWWPLVFAGRPVTTRDLVFLSDEVL